MAISFSLQNLSAQSVATSTLTASGIVRFSSNADASDITGTTGALGILGGASIAKSLWVGGGAKANYWQLNTSYDTGGAIPTAQGQIRWNTDANTVDMGMNSEVTLQVGQENFVRIKADAAITNGQVVMFTGAVGASPWMTGRPATGVTDGHYILGVATENMGNGEYGFVTNFGTVRGIDTHLWNEGDQLYYDPTVTGGLTNVIPTAPSAKVAIATVTHKGGTGSIFVRLAAGSTLGGTDTNVQFSALANGDLIFYNYSAGRWENSRTLPGDLRTSSTTDASDASGTTGALGLLGGISVAKKAYFGGGVVILEMGINRGANGTNLAFGKNALVQPTLSGTGNHAIGTGALSTLTTGSYNYAYGDNAQVIMQSGSNNVSLGYMSMNILQTESDNVAIGHRALQNGTGSSYSVAVGAFSGQILAGSYATMVGHSTTSYGSNATAIGYSAKGRSGGVSLGAFAGKYNTAPDCFFVNSIDRTNEAGDQTKSLLYGTFNDNPASQTLRVNGAFSTLGTINGATVRGDDYLNTVFGQYALENAASGLNTRNSVVGSGALSGLTEGTDNVAVGLNSQCGATTGSYNVSMGTSALSSVAGGVLNTAIGDKAAFYTSGNQNTAIGAGAYLGGLGSYNTAVGAGSLRYGSGATSGNVALGFFAGAYETESNAFYVNNQDRANTAGDKAGSLLYGTFDATPANQTLTINAKVGFNCTPAIAKPTVTGSRGSNAALASLITALANYGLITDSTS